MIRHKEGQYTSYAAGRREQTTSFKKIHESVTNVNILQFGYFVWNHYEKCIQISTNMPGIGLEICEISRTFRFCMDGETINGRVQMINNTCFDTPLMGSK